MPSHGSRVTSHGTRGFTLIEVMVSVGILGVIMVLIWSSTSQSLRAKDRIEARDMMYHEGQVALKKIADDLAVAFLTKSSATTASATTGSTEAATPAAEGSSARSEFRTFFVGEDRGELDSLKFTSLSHLRLVRGAKESDQCRISYEVVPHEEETGRYNIVRRQQPWLAADEEVGGRGFNLAEKILRFDVQYYDPRKNDWGREWDTNKVDWKDKLPMAVRVTIVYPDPDDENVEVPLTTVVVPAMWRSPIRF